MLQPYCTVMPACFTSAALSLSSWTINLSKSAAAIAAVLASPEIKDRLAALGADPAPMAAADFDKLIVQELKDNAALVKQAGITVQ